MKCLPRERIPVVQGNVLHDSHAEILAIRAFNRFLVDECADLARSSMGDGSAWVRWRNAGLSAHRQENEGEAADRPPFRLNEDVSIHMYCSEAPCGDASMELTMREQQDDTPWPSENSAGELLGRGHFDQLGIVRRKPARPDAPETLSKSCSDKLALKQCTGLLSSLTAKLVWPSNVYLSTLVLPESQYVSEACERAFGGTGRMHPLVHADIQQKWKKRGSGYAFRPFTILPTKREFDYSKRGGVSASPTHSTTEQAKAVPSNLSAVYTSRRQETLINGALEGRRWDDFRPAVKVNAFCRRAMWTAVLNVAVLAGLSVLRDSLHKATYADAKAVDGLSARREVKKDVTELALKGWKRNEGDEWWSLSRVADEKG